jgi:hypothetical protein
MKRTNSILVAALFASSLGLAGFAATAAAKDGVENQGQHKGWDNNQSKKFDHSTHDRRDFGHNQREIHRDNRWDDHRGKPVRREVRHDARINGRIDNRAHHNKAEIRQDFKDVRNSRNEVKQDQVELRKDRIELNKDRAELRKDIRNGASKAEIAGDRREIRGDLKEIAGDRAELRKDQNTLGTARQELKSDLRKR